MENEQKKSPAAEREEKVLEFWCENDIFKKSLSKDAPHGEFVFFEGPPTANAKPALHHLEARAFKDIIPRYKSMQGFHVRRKAGWDTHGLPVELQIEKKLGLQSKKDIEVYGIEKFNRECKESVFTYISDWEKFTDRIGYWVDTKSAYYTFDPFYMESVWNVIKEVNDKGLLYKDYKVLPWCTRCGTALSSHELAQGYQEDKDVSVYAKFKIKGVQNGYFVAWTTTPWTLPGNVALAVGKDIDYIEAKVGDEVLVLAKEKLSLLTEPYEIVAEHKGSEMVGMEYEPLFPYLSNKFSSKDTEAFKKAYKVYGADFVNTETGTGIVHIAPMYGQDDFVLSTNVGLPKFHVVDETGHFTSDTDFLSGRYVKEADENGKPTVAIDIIDDLKKRNLFFKQENIKHQYPHCWRCKTPLIYYARDSWYIRMSSLRSELVKENEGIDWEPKHIKEGRFGEWLREVKDWAISRERYWGTPLPVWYDTRGMYHVIGSIDDLKKHAKRSGNRYFVMRHGESESNIKKNWSIDIQAHDPLTEKGREEIKISVKRISQKIDYIVVSPFERTTETAQIAAEALGVPKEHVIICEDLAEWNVGKDYHDRSIEEYFSVRNESHDKYRFKTKDGESYADVFKRSGRALYDLEQKYSGKNILIISHGAVTRGLSLVADGFSAERAATHLKGFTNFKNAEVREIDFAPLPHNPNFELDLHRPFIDKVELIDKDGTPLTRAKEVMDVWLDSGSMPFAQDHYPFENKEWIDGRLFKKAKGYPADFISEAIDQTRGWFYTLHAVGVLMGKGKAYKNVVCLGHILDAEGKKMSKSIGNIVDPWTMLSKYGADALRLWMYSVNQPGDSKNFDERTVDELVKKVFNPLENILAFYEMYAEGKMEYRSSKMKSEYVLDRWIVSRLNQVVGQGTKSLDQYQIFESARLVRDFVTDFSTWYVRRSRERFKSDDIQEKTDALQTTAFVLRELSKYMAPFTPFFAEYVYGKVRLDTDITSVHLADWPLGGTVDEKLLQDMEKVRTFVTKALELRQKSGIKVRQPLANLQVKGKPWSSELADILKDELNVKEVVFNETMTEDCVLDTEISEELKNEGDVRDFIRAVQDARKEKNLSPGDVVTLVIETDEAGRMFIEKNKKEISKPTNIGEIAYEHTEGTEVIVVGVKFRVSLR